MADSCLMDDCTRPARARGLCDAHYKRARRQGDQLPPRKKKAVCSVDGCDRITNAKGFCDSHYRHFLKTGDPRSTPRDIDLRIWRYVDRRGPDQCWPWLGALTAGYGRIRANAKSQQAHRVTYEMLVGPIPDGLELDHLCRNTRCCNPAHLEPVSKAENILRGYGMAAIYKRRTHCGRGHPLSGPGSDVRLRGGNRQCRACERARHHERKAQI